MSCCFEQCAYGTGMRVVLGSSQENFVQRQNSEDSVYDKISRYFCHID